MTDEQEDGQKKDETVLTCVECGQEIRPEQGEEFKHVQDSKTGRDLFFCGEAGLHIDDIRSYPEILRDSEDYSVAEMCMELKI